MQTAPSLHSDLPLCAKHRRILSHMLFPDEFNQLTPIIFSLCHVRKHQQTNIQNGYRLELWAFFIANDAFPSTCHKSFPPRWATHRGNSLSRDFHWTGARFLSHWFVQVGVVVYDKTPRMPENWFGWSKRCRDMEEFNGYLLMTDGFLIQTGIDWDWMVSGFLSPA